jgi:hypothetical protein
MVKIDSTAVYDQSPNFSSCYPVFGCKKSLYVVAGVEMLSTGEDAKLGNSSRKW